MAASNGSILARALVVLAASTLPATASETYICSDGRVLTVTNKNREKLRNDPCIKQWRASEAGEDSITPMASAPSDTPVRDGAARPRMETTAEFGARMQHNFAVGRDSGYRHWVPAPR